MGSEMPFLDVYKIFNHNALTLGYNTFEKTWGFGYGFQKVLYNKFSVAPHRNNEKKLISYGLRFIHLNRDMSFDKVFNLITRLNVEYGIRWKSKYIFAGLSLNYFVYEPEDEVVYKINSLKISTGDIGGMASSMWPGYGVGIQFYRTSKWLEFIQRIQGIKRYSL